jgi:hypothetical protein
MFGRDVPGNSLSYLDDLALRGFKESLQHLIEWGVVDDVVGARADSSEAGVAGWSGVS